MFDMGRNQSVSFVPSARCSGMGRSSFSRRQFGYSVTYFTFFLVAGLLQVEYNLDRLVLSAGKGRFPFSINRFLSVGGQSKSENAQQGKRSFRVDLRIGDTVFPRMLRSIDAHSDNEPRNVWLSRGTSRAP